MIELDFSLCTNIEAEGFLSLGKSLNMLNNVEVLKIRLKCTALET